MKKLMILAAVVAVGACNKSGGSNSSANASKAAPAASTTANAAAPAAAGSPGATASAGEMPPGFPSDDLKLRGMECVTLLKAARDAGATPAGRDAPIMEQAEGQWRASVVEAGVTEEKLEQGLATLGGALGSLTTAQRDNAAAWCVENAPEVDPEG
jgi:hypothetical protein